MADLVGTEDFGRNNLCWSIEVIKVPLASMLAGLHLLQRSMLDLWLLAVITKVEVLVFGGVGTVEVLSRMILQWRFNFGILGVEQTRRPIILASTTFGSNDAFFGWGFSALGNWSLGLGRWRIV
jgi:hypothetical protein